MSRLALNQYRMINLTTRRNKLKILKLYQMDNHYLMTMTPTKLFLGPSLTSSRSNILGNCSCMKARMFLQNKFQPIVGMETIPNTCCLFSWTENRHAQFIFIKTGMFWPLSVCRALIHCIVSWKFWILIATALDYKWSCW